jgi:hypothetical protein
MATTGWPARTSRSDAAPDSAILMPRIRGRSSAYRVTRLHELHLKAVDERLRQQATSLLSELADEGIGRGRRGGRLRQTCEEVGASGRRPGGEAPPQGPDGADQHRDAEDDGKVHGFVVLLGTRR